MNTQTGMMLSLDEAAALNILDPVQGVYTDLKSKSKMLIGDAVDQKLVEIEYDNSATGMCSVVYGSICCLPICHGRVTPNLEKKLANKHKFSTSLLHKCRY